MERLGPRLVIAGTHSGVGKTTVATGLMAAFRARGTRVGSAKVGPDFIDPGYHALATGRPGRNLDAWMCELDAVLPLAGRAAAGTDLLIVEGVMGLFDGAADGTPSSTAAIAHALEAPVVLVVDASSMSQSVAAIVHGFATLRDDVTVAGVILNRVGTDSHDAMLRAAIEPTGIPVLGALRRDDAFTWRDRHLGLVPVIEHANEVRTQLDRLAAKVASACDLEALERIASHARPLDAPPVSQPDRVGSCRIAVAAGAAFSFIYEDNLEALTAAGADLVPFDPCADAALPVGCHALVAGGGFPEVYAEALAGNAPMLEDVRRQIERGLVVWAECGGLLWLSRSLDGHAMVGAIDAATSMTDRLTLGYRSGHLTEPSPLGPAGTVVRGHEFHYSITDPPGDALALTGRTGPTTGGYATPRLLASYLHLHLGHAPQLAEAFVAGAVP